MSDNKKRPYLLPVKWVNRLSVAWPDKTIVATGGFADEERVECTDPGRNVSNLKACHEEADTRIIVHAVECQADCIVIWARDTDVLVLLLGNFSNMNCPPVWMKAGTSKKQRFIPVHTIYERLTKPIVDVLIPFHAFGVRYYLILRRS